MNEGSNNTTHEFNNKTTRHQTKILPDKTNETTKLTNTSCEPQFNSGGPAAEAAAFKPDFAWNRKAHSHDAVTP